MRPRFEKSIRLPRDFLLFWASQAVSQLGSAMTSYALIIWAFAKTGSAITVSLMAFCTFLPYVAVSVLSGAATDRFSKKTVILVSDGVAAICTAALLALYLTHRLELWHVYAANLAIGFMNAFQNPAVSVATGMMVDSSLYSRASGLDSLSANLVTVSAPMLAAALSAVAGPGLIMALDLVTFAFAALVMLIFIKLREVPGGKSGYEHKSAFAGFREGLAFLRAHRGLLHIMLFMAALNFFSRLTYENILPAMLLARNGGGAAAYAAVSAVLGLGGILGGVLVSSVKLSRDAGRVIFISAAVSFAFGDILMGAGQCLALWCVAGLAASLPLPFITAAQRTLLYETVPRHMQGRIFAVRNAVQYSLIPAAILLGGILADDVFEPFMAGGSAAAGFLSRIVGVGAGSGMAVMFLITGTLGTLGSLVGMRDSAAVALSVIPQEDSPQ